MPEPVKVHVYVDFKCKFCSAYQGDVEKSEAAHTPITCIHRMPDEPEAKDIGTRPRAADEFDFIGARLKQIREEEDLKQKTLISD